MKKNFKYVTMTAAALVLVLSGCSKEETGRVEDSPKSVTVRVQNLSTYAVATPASGSMPVLYDLNVYFIGSGVIKDQGTMTTAEATSGKTFDDVPGSATKVVIIANAGELSSPNVASIATYDSENKLKQLMFEQSVQSYTAATDVNVYGTAPITGAVGSEAANVSLAPAVSRIEINSVGASTTANVQLTSFKLTGIYINNTYTQCGTDYTTVPTLPAGILNYGKDAVSFTNGSYPARFKDEWSAASVTAGDLFSPGVGNRWSYYVMPVVAGKGTTIDAVVQTSVPHIILKIEEALAPGYTFPSPAYVTIKDLRVSGTSLTALEKGKVYSIGSILIGGENLAEKPEFPANQDIMVTTVLNPWDGQPTTPTIPL